MLQGNVWVYSNHKNVDYDDILSDKYCNKTVYLFSFWLIIAFYIPTVVSWYLPCFWPDSKSERTQTPAEVLQNSNCNVF
jgi:hypothetical protein